MAVRVPARVQGRGHDVREQGGEQGRHGEGDGDGGAGEGPAFAAYPGGGEAAEQGEGRAGGEHDGGRAGADGEGPGRGRRRRATAVPRPSRTARAPARSRMSPVVLRARNTAPWVRNRPRVVRPPSRAYGLSRSSRPPTYSWSASRGTPRKMLAKATPQRRAGMASREDGGVPAAFPGGFGALVAVFEGDAAGDEGEQDEQQRQVEAGEEGGVPLGEGGEHGAAGGDAARPRCRPRRGRWC